MPGVRFQVMVEGRWHSLPAIWYAMDVVRELDEDRTDGTIERVRDVTHPARLSFTPESFIDAFERGEIL